MLKEFKEFLTQGNVMDLAVAVIIAGAFGKIIASLVNDIIMPLVSYAMGGRSVNEWFMTLDGNEYANLAEATEAGVATLSYGNFIQTIIDFVIIGFVIFMLIRSYNKANKRVEEEAGPTQEDLLTEIRDLLAK